MNPASIKLVHNEQKVVELLGWQPGIFGALLTILACFFHAPASYAPDYIEIAIFAAVGVIGLSLLYYEVWRRKNKTVFVRDGEVIAIFHGNRLDQTCKPKQIELHNMPLATFIQILCAPVFFAVGFFIFAVMIKSLKPGYRILNAVTGLCMIASCTSFIWTHFFCDALLLPGKKKQFFLETVPIRPLQMKILYPQIEYSKDYCGFISSNYHESL